MTRLLSFPPVVGEWNTRAHAAVKSVDLLPVVAVRAHLPTGPAMARARIHADATTGLNYGEALMDNAPDGLHLATLAITLSSDGGTEYVHVEAEEDLAATTLLGMLDLARAQILERLT